MYICTQKLNIPLSEKQRVKQMLYIIFQPLINYEKKIKKIPTIIFIFIITSICLISCQKKIVQIESSSKNIQQIMDIYPSIDIKKMKLNTDDIFNKEYKIISKIEFDSLRKDSDQLNWANDAVVQVIGKQKINNNYFLLIKIDQIGWITTLNLLSFDQNYTLKKSEVLLYIGGGDDEESQEPFVYKQIGLFLNDSIFQIKSFGKIFTDSTEVLLSPNISNKIINLK